MGLLRIGRARLTTPNQVTSEQAPAEEPGAAGPWREQAYDVEGRETNSNTLGGNAAATMALLERMARRYGCVYVCDDAAQIAPGHYRVRNGAPNDWPSGAPSRRPWRLRLVKKDAPFIVRQAEDDNVAGTDTADATADEGLKTVYTATATEIPVLVAGCALAGWYQLEADGADSSGRGNTATIGGAPTFGAGKIGNGMTITADGQGANPPDLGLSGSNDWGIEFLMNIDDSAGAPAGGTSRGIIMRGSTSGSFGFERNPTGLRCGIREVGGGTLYATTPVAPVSGTWVHYIIAHKAAASLTLYQNGVQVGTVAIGAFPGGTPPAGNWEMGSTSRVISGSTAATRFRGGLDEPRFYPFAPSAEEVAARYAAISGGVRPAADHGPGIELLNLPAGAWRIMARVQSRTTVTQRFRAVLRDGAGVALTSGAQVTVGAGNQNAWVWVDLGSFTVPQANHQANFVTLTVQANGDLNDVWLDAVRFAPAS